MEEATQIDKNEMESATLLAVEHAREKIAKINERTIRFIRQNPASSLLLALAAGYLAGKWVSRK